jgi:heat-inducible transcriptional repressor
MVTVSEMTASGEPQRERDLSPRQQLILSLVVREYVRSANPVSSKAIEQLGLGVSSATIRNEMAALEEKGLLAHPHTSAGRMPTEEGYRYFVERLMVESQLPLAERQMIQHQFHQVGFDLEQWIMLSASVLARSSQTAAVVTAPRIEQSRFRHVELISIRDLMALMILVLEGGVVRQQMLSLDAPMSQDVLHQVSNRLNDVAVGRTAQELASKQSQLGSFEQEVLDLLTQTMRRIDQQLQPAVYRDGLVNILRQPEFAEPLNARQIVRVLEERTLLEKLLMEMLEMGGVQVVIGGEGRWEELRDCSLVVSGYGVSGGASGALGVLGPMRMPYSRAVSTVRYVAELMSGMLQDLYG